MPLKRERYSSRIGSPVSDQKPRPASDPWLPVLALALASFATSLNVNVLAAIGAWMKPALSLDDAAFGRVVAAAGLAAAAASLLLGGRIDRHGRRTPLLAGLAMFTLGSAGYLLTADATTWIALRVITGIGGGVVLTSASSAVADLIPYARRGRAMGIITAAILLAVPVGMPVATVLATHVDWRGVFVLQAGVAAVSALLLLRTLPRGLGRAEQAVPMRVVLGRADVAAALISVLLYTGAFFATTQFLGDWLDSTARLGRSRQWILWVALGVFAALGSAMLGPIIDKMGKRRFVLLSSLVVAVGIPLLGRTEGMSLFAAVGIPIAIASAARSAALLALLTQLVSPSARGRLMGLRNAANSLGTGVVPWVGGIIVAEHGFPTFLMVAGGLVALSWTLVVFFVRDPESHAA